MVNFDVFMCTYCNGIPCFLVQESEADSPLNCPHGWITKDDLKADWQKSSFDEILKFTAIKKACAVNNPTLVKRVSKLEKEVKQLKKGPIVYGSVAKKEKKMSIPYVQHLQKGSDFYHREVECILDEIGRNLATKFHPTKTNYSFRISDHHWDHIGWSGKKFIERKLKSKGWILEQDTVLNNGLVELIIRVSLTQPKSPVPPQRS